ncbi:hypothetical protein AB1L07_02075 [Niallia alba]|uniref:hypothetical protein n=1 Tax=Niallia alba TaxID=2729105 RepID=UPI0039A12B11
MNVTVYVLTDRGWIDDSCIFTASTRKLKKNAIAAPIEATEEMTHKLKNELPMVRVKRGYYYIQAI